MIRVQQVSHADAHVAIHDVRQRVFVQEQGIAAELVVTGDRPRPCAGA